MAFSLVGRLFTAAHPSLSERKNWAYGRAVYLNTVHVQMSSLARAAQNQEEFVRQRKFAQTFGTLANAYLYTDEQDTHGEATLFALEHYEYNVCKCEYKDLSGQYPAGVDCIEHAFFRVDPLARAAIQRAAQYDAPPLQ